MTTKVSPGMSRRPRSYSEIVRLLVNEAATKLEAQTKPAYTLGVPTKRMLKIATRHRQAAEIVATCERQLKELGANISGSKLLLHYEKRNALEKDWRTRHDAAATKIRALKMAAFGGFDRSTAGRGQGISPAAADAAGRGGARGGEMSAMKVLAQEINAHLQRMEKDPAINVEIHPAASGTPGQGIHRFYYAGAHYSGGRYLYITYIRYQGSTCVSRPDAEKYLKALDAGSTKRHFEVLREQS